MELSEKAEEVLESLLMAEEQGADFDKVCCWKMTHCPPEVREQCIAYRSRQGHLCWFLTGTLCAGRRLHNWSEKKSLCAHCAVFERLTGGMCRGG